ncbi:MAG TPA: hypothetical protein VD735_05870 [Candidatus Saccharimonadales bacterium]|nr:hypothetical protein [Candidatus Saccharimonadales bacterium]
MNKSLLGTLIGLCITGAGTVWSYATGEGANMAAGLVMLIGIAVTLLFGFQFIYHLFTKRKR